MRAKLGLSISKAQQIRAIIGKDLD